MSEQRLRMKVNTFEVRKAYWVNLISLTNQTRDTTKLKHQEK